MSYDVFWSRNFDDVSRKDVIMTFSVTYFDDATEMTLHNCFLSLFFYNKLIYIFDMQ